MKKDFLRNENNKVRNCDYNIAKMNVFEYVYYYGAPFSLDLKAFISALCVVITTPFILVFYPFVLVIETVKKIKNAKYVEKYEKN